MGTLVGTGEALLGHPPLLLESWEGQVVVLVGQMEALSLALEQTPLSCWR